MAEEETEQEGQASEAEEPKGAWLKQFIILAVLVLIGQSAVAYFLVSKQIIPWYFGEEESAEQVKTVKKMEREPVQVEPPILFDVPEMTVNPLDYHTIRYLNVKMALALDSQETLAYLDDDVVAAAKLTELIRSTLNMTNYRELDEAKERGPLRQKLVNEINGSGLLKEGLVENVYFERFITQ